MPVRAHGCSCGQASQQWQRGSGGRDVRRATATEASTPWSLPAPLSEVAGRQEVLVRHSGKQLIDDLPSVQILDAPMPQMAGTVLDFCRTLDLPVDEQVITVPKFSTDRVPQRLVERCFPQLAEQLVEVPTVLSYSLLQQRNAEQIIGFPVPGRGGGARGGLQGLSQGQGSTAVCGAESVDTPVPHVRGRLGGGGLHGLSQGQGSSAFCGADHVDIPVPHGRVGKRGLQGFPRGQGSTASAVEQTIAVDRLQGFPRGQSSTASAVEQTIGVDRGGLQGFPRGQSSTASAVEQTFSQAPHRSKPRAPVHGRHDEWVCVVDVENDGEYYWNRRDNSTCWRLPRGVKHRWCLLPSGIYKDVALQVEYRVLPPL